MVVNNNIVVRLILSACVVLFAFVVFFMISLGVVSLTMAVSYLFFEPNFSVLFKCVGLPLTMFLTVRWIYKNFSRVKEFVNG